MKVVIMGCGRVGGIRAGRAGAARAVAVAGAGCGAGGVDARSGVGVRRVVGGAQFVRVARCRRREPRH